MAKHTAASMIRGALATAGLGTVAALILLFATMGPPGNVPLALATTPTPTYTSTPVPPGVVDFTMRSGPSAGAVSTCASSGSPTNVCQVPTGGVFKIVLSLDQLPDGMEGDKYIAYEARVLYSGVSQAGTYASADTTLWPECTFNGIAFPDGEVLAGCVVHVGSSGSTYSGALMSVEFTCSADGSITLVHGEAAGDTHLIDTSSTNFDEAEGVTESMTIDCGDFEVSPTPTPSTVDYSIAISDVYGDALCDSSGAPTSACDIPQGAPFAVDVVLHELPASISSYLGYDAYLGYEGLTLDQGNLEPERWPDCYFDAYYADQDHVVAGCATGIGAPPSTYTGVMTKVHFACDESGTITLQHGTTFTDLIDPAFQAWSETGSEELAISCVQPLPYPADSDGDDCPDAKESTTNAIIGGRRNFNNTWDYFDPTQDNLNRVDDIVAVVLQYFTDAGDGGYTTETDRTFVGPHGWNVGPPDGRQRVDDIVHALNHYYHDCS